MAEHYKGQLAWAPRPAMATCCQFFLERVPEPPFCEAMKMRAAFPELG